MCQQQLKPDPQAEAEEGTASLVINCAVGCFCMGASFVASLMD